MKPRDITKLIPGAETSDGAGVKLRRSIGQSALTRIDPFLMLDEFFSDRPEDYLAGFPSHPHRGFETVTYMLDGHMLHEDHMGNRGDLRPGDVQWMTAGRGIIHSEMPQQQEGRMRGFQLWINLPASEKMKPADYQDIPASRMPWQRINHNVQAKAIAGNLTVDGVALHGAVQGKTTDPLYVDFELAPDTALTIPVSAERNGFIYVFEGSAIVAGRTVPHRTTAVLGEGDELNISAGENGCRFLLIAAKPIGEPIVQYGPFVMNTVEEIHQAIDDYRNGVLAGE